ncbi:MAG: type II toxin-antitoxin system Phd/YefM family antitoxin [Sulfobacillus sp.]
MEQVGIRQLRDELAAYLRLVRAGQSLLITDRGAPVALFSTADDTIAGLAALAAEGVVQSGAGRPRGVLRPAVVHGGPIADLVVGNRR